MPSSVRIAALFAFRSTDKAKKSHAKPLVPVVGNGSIGMCEAVLSVEGAVGAAALRGAAAGGYATRDVVACEDDLEVVGHEGAHVAVGVANFVLRLTRKSQPIKKSVPSVYSVGWNREPTETQNRQKRLTCKKNRFFCVFFFFKI